jgi:hypothetical protein
MFPISLLFSILAPIATAVPLHEPRSVTWWKPTPLTPWNVILSTSPPKQLPPTIQIYDIDLFDTPTTTITALHKAAKKVICYISTGTLENWRPDFSQFPSSVQGNQVDGWPGEVWLDTRSTIVRNLMAQRIALAQSKGCDGIDPDNMDAYDNDTGFPLTEDDSIGYITFLATAAHSRGLAIGLKNCPEIIQKVVSEVEWSVAEQCVDYDECDSYQPFIAAGKPVFQIEYPDVTSLESIQKVCSESPAQFSTLIKELDLGQWYTSCSNIVPI